MDAFMEELMLRLARELASSHGTFFAAALLADMGVPLTLALTALACQPCATSLMHVGAFVDGGKGSIGVVRQSRSTRGIKAIWKGSAKPSRRPLPRAESPR